MRASDRTDQIDLKKSERFTLEGLKARYPAGVVVALYGFAAAVIGVALLAVVDHFSLLPMVFPSLGPTAFLLFCRPLERAASPRNAILGHLVGASAGWFSLLLFGLEGIPGPGLGHISWARLGATALSIGLTIGLMELWDVPHAPAGATTMIVSLGIMPHLRDILVLMLSVIALVIIGWGINRAAGVPYPASRPAPGSGGASKPSP